MAALDDALDFYFTETMTFARFLLNPDTIENAVDDVLTGLAAYANQPPQALKNAISVLVVGYRADYITRKRLARDAFNLALAWVLTEMGSPYVDGGSISSESAAYFELRRQMISDTTHVAPRDVVPAADPAAGSGVLVERLSVDHTGQTIEGGIHSETVTGRVTLAPVTGGGPGRFRLLLTGEEGPTDDLDYRNRGTAQNVDIPIDFFGDLFPAALTNSTFFVTGSPTDGATVDEDNLAGWEGSDQTGTPTVVFRTASPWRNKTGSVEISGNGTAKRYEQTLVLPAEGHAYRPISGLSVFTPSAGFQGSVTITIGSMVKTIAHGAMSLNALNYLLFDKDENRYPVNFDTGSTVARIDIAVTAGSLKLHFFDAQLMTARQGHWYACWNHTADPVLEYEVSWADTCDYTGSNQDTVCVAYDQAPFAYLVTSGAGVQYPDV